MKLPAWLRRLFGRPAPPPYRSPEPGRAAHDPAPAVDDDTVTPVHEWETIGADPAPDETSWDAPPAGPPSADPAPFDPGAGDSDPSSGSTGRDS